MAGPKPGGDKQALMDAYGAAKAQNAPTDADAAAEQAQGVTDGDENGGTPQLDTNPEVKSMQLQLQHLEHLLVAKGIISPTDLITPPAPMPPGPPMGGGPGMPPPPGAPPGPPQ